MVDLVDSDSRRSRGVFISSHVALYLLENGRDSIRSGCCRRAFVRAFSPLFSFEFNGPLAAPLGSPHNKESKVAVGTLGHR